MWDSNKYFDVFRKNGLSQILASFLSPPHCMPHISWDLKLAAVRLHEDDLLALPDILNSCNISRVTFYRIWKTLAGTGNIVSHRNTSHQTCLLNGSDIQYLNQLIEENTDYFLNELLSLLKTNCFISVHYTTIHNQLLCSGVSYKKLQCITSERDEDTCANFIARISQYPPHELGFINEGFQGWKINWQTLWLILLWAAGLGISTVCSWAAYFNCWMPLSQWVCLGNFSGGFIHEGFFFGLAETVWHESTFFLISLLEIGDS